MNPRLNKRRARSDEGLNIEKNLQLGSSGSSNQSGKHNSNLRQARMIYPFSFNQLVMQPFISTQMCAPSLPQPFVSNNSISFTLLPFRTDLNYQFSIQLEIGQRVYVTTNSQLMFPLSFALNRHPFINVSLPVDITPALQNGSNLISFQPINSPQPIFVSIYLSPPVQITELIDKVINEFPHVSVPNLTGFSGALPFVTLVDPISREQITHPCRGENCAHLQCFNLGTFLEKCISDNSWLCPICSTNLPFEELRFDPNFFEIVAQYEHQQANIQQMQMNPIQPLNPGLFNQQSVPAMKFHFGFTSSQNPIEQVNCTTPMSAPTLPQLPMSGSTSPSASMSTQSDDAVNLAVNSPSALATPPIQQPSFQFNQEQTMFDDFNDYNDEFGFPF